jgi:hypothetical protein
LKVLLIFCWSFIFKCWYCHSCCIPTNIHYTQSYDRVKHLSLYEEESVWIEYLVSYDPSDIKNILTVNCVNTIIILFHLFSILLHWCFDG